MAITFRASRICCPPASRLSRFPAFGNITGRYRLTDLMARALTREFITRTRYQVVADENQADAVLKGAVVNYLFFPNVVDQVTGPRRPAFKFW